MVRLYTPHEHMISRVVRALGPELASKVAFVGGCATPLLVTDELVHAGVRFTDDVDIIVHVLGFGEWYALEGHLAARGFRSSQEDEVICRKRLRDDEPEELIVDFMPDDQHVLGFSNRWYTQALNSAFDYKLSDGSVVRLVTAPYFIGTKLEAYKGRGNNDPLGSRDIEDILNVVAGRPTLIDEIEHSPDELRQGIAEDLAALMRTRDFDYAVASACNGNAAREHQVFERLDTLAARI